MLITGKLATGVTIVAESLRYTGRQLALGDDNPQEALHLRQG